MVKPVGKQQNYDFAELSMLGGPRFVVTIDTEEEFEWSKPFSREQQSVKHIGGVHRFQKMCTEYGVRPAYLIDHPIANDDNAVDILGNYARKGEASIGVHLHPWVTPPFVEEVSTANSYSCNLPAALERKKLESIHGLIVEKFGFKPDMYRAGRYGIGPNTPAILRDLGIRIDSSIRANFDYTADSGPNHAMETVHPHWLQREELIELPVTTVFRGALQNVGPTMFAKMFESSTARSLLSRTGMLERIALTPEGISIAKAKEGIDAALEQGIGLLTFSFHSPSLAVGYTPYVKTAADLEEFYVWWTEIFSYLAKKNVRPASVEELVTGFFGESQAIQTQSHRASA